METQNKILATHSTAGKSAGRAIRLDIAGPDLLLTGTFEQWVPLVMEGLREDRSVQLLIDVTSSSPRLSPVQNSNGTLFSFRATSIKRAKPRGHKVLGLLTHGVHQAETEIFLQAPPNHSPFALLSFELPNEEFEGLWQDLGKQADSRGAEGDTEVRAQGWLRPPTVAAA